MLLLLTSRRGYEALNSSNYIAVSRTASHNFLIKGVKNESHNNPKKKIQKVKPI